VRHCYGGRQRRSLSGRQSGKIAGRFRRKVGSFTNSPAAL